MKKYKQIGAIIIMISLVSINIFLLYLNASTITETKNLKSELETYRLTLKEIESYETLLSDSSAMIDEYKKLEEKKKSLTEKINDLKEKNESLSEEIASYKN